MPWSYTDFNLIEEFKEELKANEFYWFLDWSFRTAEILREEEDKPLRRPWTNSEALWEETRLRDI